MTKGIIVGFFCFLLFLSHIFIFHNFNIKRRFFMMVKVFASGLVVYLLLFLMIDENSVQRLIGIFVPMIVLGFLNGAFLHFFFWYFYLHFIQIVDRTPTARIMIEIQRSPEKRLSLEEMKRLYSIDRKISCELEDMVVLGHLSRESDFYKITPKGRKHMLIFKNIRNYLKLRRS